MGSNGEAVHLSSDERAQVIEAAREAAEADGGRESRKPILVGCGDQSTRATSLHCQQAARYGADVALVLPPFYFRSNMNQRALLTHYRAVADASPLPVLIYNMPANTAGLDLDAATVCTLAQHPNIVGIKDSSGNIAKLTQVVANSPATFKVFAGSASFLFPTLVIGGVGSVSALANIFPREVCRVQELFTAGQLEEARIVQARIIAPNVAVTSGYGVPGLKAGLELIAGYGGRPRMPLLPLTEEERGKLAEILGGLTSSE
jgi:4-hydroxy-2-oxoglutarate aldolase